MRVLDHSLLFEARLRKLLSYIKN
ncbi:uncharacterized protein METZ01_LOCUS97816 [marine metagenome]|uniref:Uncharacterized protein n=1 Tax=marine metagenome TaxID=408172 RepID=A0A381VXL4_9ZZZZ